MKRIVLIFFSILFFHCSNAQSIQVADSNFQKWLLKRTWRDDNTATNYYIDADYNGIITKEEAEKVKEFNVDDGKISSLEGIEQFKNLERLYCPKNKLVGRLSLKGLTKLKELYCQENQISELELPATKILTQLVCDRNLITKLNLDGFKYLKVLDCSKNQLTLLQLNNTDSLVYLNCMYNDIRELKLENKKKLKTVIAHFNNLEKLNLSDCPALDQIGCTFNSRMSSMELKNLTALSNLFCNDNNLEKIVLINTPKLTTIWASDNKLRNISFNKASLKRKDLFELLIFNNPITDSIISALKKRVNVRTELPHIRSTIKDFVNEKAHYNGDWDKYIFDNLAYPDSLGHLPAMSFVYVKLTIDRYGEIEKIEPINGHKLLQAEAIRLIKNSGKWIPAKIDNKAEASVLVKKIYFAKKHS